MSSSKPKQEPLRQHPSDELLEAFASKQLGPIDASNVQQHVSKCKRCQSILDEFRVGDSAGQNATNHNQAIHQTPIAESPKAHIGQNHKATVAIPPELVDHPHYRVLKRIGRGGMGDVFLVEHKLTARKEVLKVIHAQLLDQEDVRSRFRREIQSAAKLNHPNVVRTLTAIEQGNMIGLVMEYVQGEGLSAIVRRNGPLPVEVARDFVRQIAEGLAHAHQQQMVHRDIKPQNILVSQEGNEQRVKILDFGLAKETGGVGANPDLTMDGRILGTPHFMSPEQGVNPTLADIRSDLYSLGCTWFFMLTGKPPFEGTGPLAILNSHQNQPLPLASSLRLGVPAETENLLAQLMAKRPEHRFQTPEELIRALTAPTSTDMLGAKNVPRDETRNSTTNFALPTQADNDLSSGQDLDFSFSNLPKKAARRSLTKKRSPFPRIALLALPSIVFIGIILLRPQWITQVGQLLRPELRNAPSPIPESQSRIVLGKIPSDVMVYIDDYPARFERNRADASPSIAAAPGTYKLSMRRQDKEFYSKTVTLGENQSLELELDPSLYAAQPVKPDNNQKDKGHERDLERIPSSPIALDKPLKEIDNQATANQPMGEPSSPTESAAIDYRPVLDLLRRRDWPGWKQWVATLSIQDTEEHSSLERIQELVVEHDQLILQGVKTLSGGNSIELELKGSRERVSFVEASLKAITIRVRGANRSFEWTGLPASLSTELLQLAPSSSTIERKLLAAIGICLSSQTSEGQKNVALAQLEEAYRDIPISQPSLLRKWLSQSAEEEPTANAVARNAPLNIFKDGSSNSADKPFEPDPDSLAKKFAVQQRLLEHGSPVIRVGMLQDGRVYSAERNGKQVPVAKGTKMNYILVWNKDGRSQTYPTDIAMEDFALSQNGLSICYVCRAGSDLAVQLNVNGQGVWQSKVLAENRVRADLPTMSYTNDSEEFLLVTKKGTFTKLNFRTKKVPPPVSALDNIDPAKTASITLSPKLDHAFFGMTNGELKAVRTRDGKTVVQETGEEWPEPNLERHTQPIIWSQLNSREKKLAVLHVNGSLELFDFPSMKRLPDLVRTLDGTVNVVGRSANGRFLAAVDGGQRVAIYDLDNGELYAFWKVPKEDLPKAIAVDNNGRRVVLGHESGSVVMYQQGKE